MNEQVSVGNTGKHAVLLLSAGVQIEQAITTSLTSASATLFELPPEPAEVSDGNLTGCVFSVYLDTSPFGTIFGFYGFAASVAALIPEVFENQISSRGFLVQWQTMPIVATAAGRNTEPAS